MSFDHYLDEAEGYRESNAGKVAADTAALMPGVNIVSEGADAELQSLLAMRDFRDGNVMSGLKHEGSAALHAGTAALNFLTMGEAGPELEMAHQFVKMGHIGEFAQDTTDALDVAVGGGHSIADAASSHMRTQSLGDAARSHFDYSSINAIPAGGPS
jgi:hypothetical protein